MVAMSTTTSSRKRRTPRSAAERATTARIFSLRPERAARVSRSAEPEPSQPTAASSALSADAVAREREAALANCDSLSMLHAEAAEYALLSRDEEQVLARQAQAGDAAARERFLNANIRLVSKVASHYARPGASVGAELADLVNEGVEGLIHAFELYDPDSGFRFSTYATAWIRQRIARALIDRGARIRIPAYMAHRMQLLRRLRSQMEAQTGEPPTLEALAAAAALTLEETQDALALADGAVGGEVVSLDTLHISRRGGDPFTLADLIIDPRAGETFDAAEDAADAAGADSVTSIMRELAARSAVARRQMEIVALRAMRENPHEQTLEMIGAQFGITRERARQLEAAGLARIRKERENRRRAHLRQQQERRQRGAHGHD